MRIEAVEQWVVAIMAKAPLAGDVKTRLCPPLTVAEAAELYRAFLLDKIEQVRSLEAAGHAIAFTPERERGIFEGLAPDFTLIPQRGADLGGRLAASFEQFFARGHAGVLLIDSDTPTLPIEFLFEALELIAKPGTDLVLGPSEDGGYYLIGLRARRPELFEGIAWSTPAVLPETIRRARDLGLGMAWLPRWFDVDTGSDLRRLRASLAATGAASPRHTRLFLDALPP
jgi:uncharacterized protein